jgi:vacuolar-type H+-ATPase subunit F/Vma7
MIYKKNHRTLREERRKIQKKQTTPALITISSTYQLLKLPNEDPK